MTPRTFASYSPRELQLRIEGYRRVDDRALYHVATLASWVLNAIGSRATQEKLIGDAGATVLPPLPPLPIGKDDD